MGKSDNCSSFQLSRVFILHSEPMNDTVDVFSD